jgi:hypothetical protein
MFTQTSRKLVRTAIATAALAASYLFVGTVPGAHALNNDPYGGGAAHAACMRECAKITVTNHRRTCIMGCDRIFGPLIPDASRRVR